MNKKPWMGCDYLMQQAEGMVALKQTALEDDEHLEEVKFLVEFDHNQTMTMDMVRDAYVNSRQVSHVGEYVTIRRWFSGIVGDTFHSQNL